MKTAFDMTVSVPMELRDKLVRMARMNGMAPDRLLHLGIRAQLDELESGRLKPDAEKLNLKDAEERGNI